jgi:hypothetical protein
MYQFGMDLLHLNAFFSMAYVIEDGSNGTLEVLGANFEEA